MRLSFGYVELTDFKSFVGTHAIDFVRLSTGLHFIRGENTLEERLGSNGAGKTTVFDALCWCLFGRTPGGLRNPDIKPWGKRKTKTGVRVLFAIGQVDHTLERTASPNSLTLDGEEVTNEVVVALLGFNYDLFINTIVFAQSHPLFFDLQPRDKMQLFIDVLNLDKWDERSKRASAEVASLSAELTGIESDAHGIEIALEEVESLLEQSAAQSKEWKASIKAKQSKLEERLQAYFDESEALRPRVETGELNYDAAMAELKSARKQANDAREEVFAAQKQIDAAARDISFSKQEARRLQGSLDELGDGKDCPVCGQPVKGTMIAAHQKELKAELKDANSKIEAGIPPKLQKALEDAEHRHRVLLDSVQEFEDKAREAETVVNVHRPRLSELKGFIVEMNTQLDELGRQSNPHTEQTATLRAKRSSLQNDLEDIQDDQRKLGRRIERARFWVKGFKDIRLLVVDEVLQELELTTNTLLEDIGLVSWNVHYDVEQETKSGSVKRGLNVSIQSPTNKNPVRWESWSGGEGQRLRLVGALALSEVLLNYAGIQTNLEVLDEPTRHLSAEGARDLVEILADRAEQLDRSVFYIDHLSVESARFASVVTVVKDEDGSRLEID